MRYLSSQWIRAADAAVKAASSTAPEGRVVVDQLVRDVADYRVSISRNSCSITALVGGLPTPDAVFRQSGDTARAVAQGTTDAHQAFLLGQITFEGDIGVLIERRDAFTWLATVLEPLLAQTSFD